MYQRILVPIDGSTTSTKGLDEAVKLAKLTGASLRIIYVVDAASFARGIAPYGAYDGDVTSLMEETGKKILEQGKNLVEASGVKGDSLLLDSLGTRASDAIIAQAREWNADLIVIGTHGRRGVGRWLLGSDAEQVLRMAPVPVLLVRAPEIGSKADTTDGVKGLRSATGGLKSQGPLIFRLVGGICG